MACTALLGGWSLFAFCAVFQRQFYGSPPGCECRRPLALPILARRSEGHRRKRGSVQRLSFDHTCTERRVWSAQFSEDNTAKLE